VDAPLESLVGALAGVDLAVHFLCDVHPELQRGDRAAPETRLGRVINACGSGKTLKTGKVKILLGIVSYRLLTGIRGWRYGIGIGSGTGNGERELPTPPTLS